MEFDEAQRLKIPTLLFVMGDDHDVKPRDVETDPEKIPKLNAFRERAKIKTPGSTAHRVYSVFNSLEEFQKKIGPSLAELF